MIGIPSSRLTVFISLVINFVYGVEEENKLVWNETSPALMALVTTDFDNNDGYDENTGMFHGNMFEVSPFSDVMLYEIEIHTNLDLIGKIQVWKKDGPPAFSTDNNDNGDDAGTEDHTPETTWTLIIDASKFPSQKKGKGRGGTRIPMKDFLPVILQKDLTYSFYVSLDSPNLISTTITHDKGDQGRYGYSNHDMPIAHDSHISIMQGVGVSTKYSPSFAGGTNADINEIMSNSPIPVSWNGALYYRVPPPSLQINYGGYDDDYRIEGESSEAAEAFFDITMPSSILSSTISTRTMVTYAYDSSVNSAPDHADVSKTLKFVFAAMIQDSPSPYSQNILLESVDTFVASNYEKCTPVTGTYCFLLNSFITVSQQDIASSLSQEDVRNFIVRLGSEAPLLMIASPLRFMGPMRVSFNVNFRMTGDDTYVRPISTFNAVETVYFERSMKLFLNDKLMFNEPPISVIFVDVKDQSLYTVEKENRLPSPSSSKRYRHHGSSRFRRLLGSLRSDTDRALSFHNNLEISANIVGESQYLSEIEFEELILKTIDLYGGSLVQHVGHVQSDRSNFCAIQALEAIPLTSAVFPEEMFGAGRSGGEDLHSEIMAHTQNHYKYYVTLTIFAFFSVGSLASLGYLYHKTYNENDGYRT